jgi:hypothetical protein
MDRYSEGYSDALKVAALFAERVRDAARQRGKYEGANAAEAVRKRIQEQLDEADSAARG